MRAVVMGSLGNFGRSVWRAALAGALATGTASCAAEYVMIQTAQFPEPMIFEDALAWTREATNSFSTMHDFEAARDAAYGGLGQLEGLHMLVPDNEDGLFLLSRSWTAIAYAFIDDEREMAMARKDDSDVEYQKARARAAFKRGRFYGEELLNQRFDGYKAAQRNSETLTAWLRENYTDPALARELMWLGFAIVGRIAFDQDNPEAVSELWVGVHMLERVVELDETVEHGTAHTILGAYHARSATAELAEAKKHFDRAMQINGGKLLSTELSMASRYYCFKRDKENYAKALNRVLEAGDPMPSERLGNTISKRRARRYLTHPEIFQKDCAFEG